MCTRAFSLWKNTFILANLDVLFYISWLKISNDDANYTSFIVHSFPKHLDHVAVGDDSVSVPNKRPISQSLPSSEPGRLQKPTVSLCNVAVDPCFIKVFFSRQDCDDKASYQPLSRPHHRVYSGNWTFRRESFRRRIVSARATF